MGLEQIGESFTLEKKASFANLQLMASAAPSGSSGLPAAAASRAAGGPEPSFLEDNDVGRPLLDDELSVRFALMSAPCKVVSSLWNSLMSCATVLCNC